MRFIANILTENKIESKEYYNVVSNKEDCIKDIPTLIIGWEKTKENYPTANILEWEIDDNTFWIYGPREKRDRYEKDIHKFYQIVVDKFIKNYKYTFLDVLTEPKEKVLKFLNSLKDTRKKTIYVANNILYVYYEGNKNIIGVSLRDIEYMNHSTKEFFAHVYGSEFNFLVKDVPFAIKNEVKNKLYIIPCLYSV